MIVSEAIGRCLLETKRTYFVLRRDRGQFRQSQVTLDVVAKLQMSRLQRKHRWGSYPSNTIMPPTRAFEMHYKE